MSTVIEWPRPPVIPIDRTTLRLPAGQYVQERHPKAGIVLHHTVGGSAKSTYDWWNRKGPDGKPVERVGTAYMIDRDGTIYECFDPEHWAFHLGLKGTNGRHDKTTIGIELCSEGGLVLRDGYTFNQLGAGRKHTDVSVDLGRAWRGYRYFDAYETEQTTSLASLVYELLERFPSIPRACPGDPWVHAPAWLERGGVYSHSHVRTDKSDIHPLGPWAMLIGSCRLAVI